MTNIREIAKRAGVSVTTVSRVLNEHPYVASDKRERVEAVIREMDYTPNRSATNLARGKTNTIGVILPYNDHPWFAKLVSGILEEAFHKRYSVTLLPTNYDPVMEKKHLMRLKTKQVDGIIVTSRANKLKDIEEFTEFGRIVVCEETNLTAFSSAYIDRFHAYQDGFRLLLQKGYKNIAFTTGRSEVISPSTRNKIRAFEETFGRKADNTNLLRDCASVADGMKAAKYFFGGDRPRPDAIYATDDETAAGIIKYAKENGIRIPEDLAILGQENLPIGQVLDIATLDLHIEKLGKTAFTLFDNPDIQKKQIQHEIIERKTL